MSSTNDSTVLVAAIDFGTTFSGYAFSFKSSPDDIKMNKNWGECLGFQSVKTPTCVLTGPEDKFEAFGFEAEMKYGDMSEGTGSEGWNMFRQFKMILHKKENVSSDSIIYSSSGKPRPAMDIFVMSLKYLKNHLVETVAKQVSSYPDAEMIKWVITVPAIWSDESKQFMREAAYDAGLITKLDSKKLMVALEPEVASLYCRSLHITQFVENSEPIQLKAGTKYLVIDCGGGTIDITAHQILQSGHVKELLSATGGAWGGKEVDANFVKLLRTVLKDEFVNKYQKQCPQQWLSLMTIFEKMKRGVKPDGKSTLNIPLSWSMGSKYNEIMNGRNIEQAINSPIGEMEGVKFSNGNLVLNNKAVRALFIPVIDHILSHVQDLLQHMKLHPCKYFFLVGGFSESLFLQGAIKERFAGMVDVLVPNETQMSVIKGAVMFGHNPMDISTRVARRTYGYGHMMPFDEKIHDINKRSKYKDVFKCKDLFGTLVVKGEEVDIGSSKEIEFTSYGSTETEATFRFFAIDRQPTRPVQYIDDIDVESLGKVKVVMPRLENDQQRKVKLKVSFGGTEIEVQAMDVFSGTIAETSINFLAK